MSGPPWPSNAAPTAHAARVTKQRCHHRRALRGGELLCGETDRHDRGGHAQLRRGDEPIPTGSRHTSAAARWMAIAVAAKRPPNSTSARGELSRAPRSICVPRWTKNTGMAKPSPRPTSCWATRRGSPSTRNHRADGEAGDQDRRAEPSGQPRAGEQGEQRDAQVEPPAAFVRQRPHAVAPPAVSRATLASTSNTAPASTTSTLPSHDTNEPPVASTMGRASTVTTSAMAIHAVVMRIDRSDRAEPLQHGKGDRAGAGRQQHGDHARSMEPDERGEQDARPRPRAPQTVAVIGERRPRATSAGARSRTGRCVPTTNINRANPMLAKPVSAGFAGSTQFKPPAPITTPAAISPTITGGPKRCAAASSGPTRPGRHHQRQRGEVHRRRSRAGNDGQELRRRARPRPRRSCRRGRS